MPDVGRSMQQLLDYPEDNVEETFCLNFTITVENFGATEVKELVLNGADTAVNKQNRKLLEDVFYQNKQLNQEKGRHRIPQNRIQYRREAKRIPSAGTAAGIC
ncbi:probable E3 ubiquitin-protein ligase HERC4 [Desmodus rotundus]|uniref:probable E3 ubiquitin-protein ligase HERC4 n=1 Tax=Desmodus rotundus TaxID=9430 RepID=UPI0023812D34|nr:probable E3 ubiquitin-protein ligase HERC4 [Desmodus rotundus]